jgi:hypothetical protein
MSQPSLLSRDVGCDAEHLDRLLDGLEAGE